jgi:hypothetical protein
MVKTLVALYKDPLTAQRVVEALLETGFSGDDISLLVKDAKAGLSASDEISPGDGAGLGALVGALVGIGSVFIPGIGTLFGDGALAVALTAGIGAATGALTGGISASLLELGLNEEESSYYESGLYGGGTIVSVTSNEEWLEWAAKIMQRHHPLKIEEREAKWYVSDWSGNKGGDAPEHDSRSNMTQALADTPERPPISTSLKRIQRVRIYDN